MSAERFCWRCSSALCVVEPGAGGREGPKSSSEELDASSASGDG